MKSKMILLAVLLALSTHGSSCIREGFVIPVNLTVGQCYSINPGPAGQFSPTGITTTLYDLIDDSYRGEIEAVRYYDIKVWTSGSYGGTVVAQVFVDGVQLLSIGGGTQNTTPIPWSTLSTPQSLLGSSQYVRASAPGIAALVTALNRMISDENATVTLRASGTTAGAAIPSGLSVCVQVLAQADAVLNRSDN